MYRRRNKTGSLQYLRHKEAARTLVHERLTHFNAHYRLEYKKVFIKNSRSRWGSCSSRHNLNFNYRIVHLRPNLQDYLVVHELCHLSEFNHSPTFWALVAEQVPHYKELRSELRHIRFATLRLKNLVG